MRASRCWLYAALALAVLWAGPAGAGGSARSGRTLAIKHCSKCHVIEGYNRMGGIDSTLPFHVMARKPETYPSVRFRTFDERPPHPPFADSLGLTDRDRDDLGAFYESLRDQ